MGPIAFPVVQSGVAKDLLGHREEVRFRTEVRPDLSVLSIVTVDFMATETAVFLNTFPAANKLWSRRVGIPFVRFQFDNLMVAFEELLSMNRRGFIGYGQYRLSNQP